MKYCTYVTTMQIKVSHLKYLIIKSRLDFLYFYFLRERNVEVTTRIIKVKPVTRRHLAWK